MGQNILFFHQLLFRGRLLVLEPKLPEDMLAKFWKEKNCFGFTVTSPFIYGIIASFIVGLRMMLNIQDYYVLILRLKN